MASEPQRPLWIRCLDGLVLVLALMLGSLPSWRRIALQCFLFVAVIDGALSISWLVIQIISIPSPIQLNSPAITPIPKGTNNREASEQPSNPTPSSPSSQYLHGATLVVDVGSLYTRYGLSGPTFSCKQFPTVLSTGLGDSKESSPYECNLEPPLMSGRIFNWEALELVWTRVATEHADLPLLLSWSPLYSRSDAERAASFAFDSLAVPALCLGLSPVLSLHAAGRTSGCVLESGESQTLVLCVRDGRAAMDTLSTSAFSGEAMSQRIRSLLIAQDRYSHLTNNPTKLRRAKEKYMCVSANKFMAMYQASATTQRSFALPDATRVFTESDDNEDSIWSCADAMFSQVECDLLNALSPGYVTMHDCVASAVAKYKGYGIIHLAAMIKIA